MNSNLLRHPEYQYLDLCKEALEKGVKQTDKGTGAVTYSLFGRQCHYDFSYGFPLLTSKRVYWKGVLYELFWFMKGMNNIKYLVDHNVHIWDDYPYKIYNLKFKIKNFKNKNIKPLTKEKFINKIKTDSKFARKWGRLPKIYGELWRSWPAKSKKTIDQLKWVIEEIKKDPDAHNTIVTSWNPEYLYTMAQFKDTSHFPICHNMYQVNVKKGRVYLQLYQRSADLFLGVPFNIASYALLSFIIAHVTGYKPGGLVHTFGDVHIYSDHIDQIKEQMKRKPKPFPKIKIVDKTHNIDSLKPDDIILENYNPHPPIKAKLTIAGGYFSR